MAKRRLSGIRRAAKKRRTGRVSRIRRKATRRTRAIVARQLNAVVETNLLRNVGDITIGRPGGTNWNLGIQCFCLGPNSAINNGVEIAQGFGSGNRIGNKIMPVRGIFKMMITFLPYDATFHPTPQPVYFKYWVVRATSNVAAETLGDVIGWQDDFFDNGNADTPMQGNIRDMMLPINSVKYRVLKQGTRKLFFAGYQGVNSPGVNGGDFRNNDFALNAKVTINYRKYLPKTISFDDDSRVPTSKPVWLLLAAYNANGSVMGQSETPLGITLVHDFRFKA